MKTIIQRILSCTVEVRDKIISKTEKGILIFLGIQKKRYRKRRRYIVRKNTKLKDI